MRITLVRVMGIPKGRRYTAPMISLTPSVSAASQWPDVLSFEAFCQALPISRDSIYRCFFDTFSEQISVRNPSLATVKLETILNATFKISARKGFHGMSLRDLCEETGLSMGGVYNYFSGKDELSAMIVRFVGETFAEQALGLLSGVDDAPSQMEMLIRAHIYMGELFQPWYYFVYMEAKSLAGHQKKAAVGNEQRSVERFRRVIDAGVAQGVFQTEQPALTASSIMALIDGWYLKHGYFKQQQISVEQYSEFVVTSMRQMLRA